MVDVYSSQSVHNEYLTLKGIELRTGLKSEELYTAILGEMIDNSADDMENHGVDNPHIHVAIKSVTTKDGYHLLEMSVRNTVNPQRGHVFSKELLEGVYSFGFYYGSKRFYKLNRGALGDASKLMLGAPYALADSMNIALAASMGVYYPITHRTGSNSLPKTFRVGLSPTTHKVEIIEEAGQAAEDFTEVQILLPVQSDYNSYPFYHFLRDYIIQNTHIGFSFYLPDVFDSILHFPATQPMINAGKNLSSQHFYDLSEFIQLIKELQDTEQTFYDMASKTFRGANNLPIDSLTLTTIGELQKSANKIQKIFKIAEKKIPELSKETGLKSMIPFDTNKTVRREALEKRLSQMAIPCDRVKYKQQYETYTSDDKQIKYPFFFEVFVGHSDRLQTQLKVVQSVNSKAVLYNSLVFSGPYKFNFKDKGDETL